MFFLDVSVFCFEEGCLFCGCDWSFVFRGIGEN